MTLSTSGYTSDSLSVSIASTVNDIISEEINHHLKPKDNTVHVTEIVGCLRFAWYVRKYGRKHNEDTLLGSYIHEKLTRKLSDRLGCEYEVHGEIRAGNTVISGRADILCSDYIVELKTSRRPGLKETWMLQCLTYMAMFNKDKCVVISVSRPKLEIIGAYTIYRNDDIVNKIIIPRALELMKSIQNDIEPESKDTSFCSNCEFRQICNRNKKLDEISRH